MDFDKLITQVESVESQLAAIKAQLKRAKGNTSPKTAADLYGICAGQSYTTEEDLEAVKYRAKWDGGDMDEGPA